MTEIISLLEEDGEPYAISEDGRRFPVVQMITADGKEVRKLTEAHTVAVQLNDDSWLAIGTADQRLQKAPS